MLGKFKDLFL